MRDRQSRPDRMQRRLATQNRTFVQVPAGVRLSIELREFALAR